MIAPGRSAPNRVSRIAYRISRIAAIVLHYNSLRDTLACLDSLGASRGVSIEPIVIDNAVPPKDGDYLARDGASDTIRAAYPAVRLIGAGENLGYAGGNNLGIRAALQGAADAILLINNDTLLDPDCVSQLALALAAHPRIGVVGPMVYTWHAESHVAYRASRIAYRVSHIASAGGAIDWRRADSINVGAGEIDCGQYPARSVDFVNGCGLLIARSAIEHVGLLDERYFMYWEEVDWCTRARRAGFDARFEPAARMRHRAAIRSDELGPAALYYMTRNRLLFFAGHAPLKLKPIALAHAIRGARRAAARHERAGRMEHARAMRAGIRHALCGCWGRQLVADSR